MLLLALGLCFVVGSTSVGAALLVLNKSTYMEILVALICLVAIRIVSAGGEDMGADIEPHGTLKIVSDYKESKCKPKNG